MQMRKFEYRGEKVILLLPPENWFSKFPVPVRNPFQRPEPVYPDPEYKRLSLGRTILLGASTLCLRFSKVLQHVRLHIVVKGSKNNCFHHLFPPNIKCFGNIICNSAKSGELLLPSRHRLHRMQHLAHQSDVQFLRWYRHRFRLRPDESSAPGF